MFTKLLPARFAALALAAAVGVPAASAQGIASPAGVATPTLGGSAVHTQPYHGRHGWVRPRPRPVPLPYNPIVDQDGFTDVEYDPFSNVIDVNRQRISKRLSAYDPHRGYVDPGSLRHVDRWIQVNGQWVREHGTTWTSHGVPHGNLTRDRSTFRPFPGHGGLPGHGGIRENDRDTVIYSQPANPGSSLPSGPGGVRENSSDTVLFSTAPPSQNANGGNVQPRAGQILPRGGQRRR
ncbi:hypothetical protein [Alienimonas sp. DA493]|uniref:hypothetical protein n=1 Tax=Alienimonas sp. DA493 TaxID=3373605 RepID=UPI0037549870